MYKTIEYIIIVSGKSNIDDRLWLSGKVNGLRCYHISGSINLPCKTKSHFLGHTLHGYELLHFGPFEYPGDGLSMGCTFHSEIRYVSLIDLGLTLLLFQKKKNLI